VTEDIRICFIGDSFVNGTGDEMALGWSGRLCAAAHASGKPVTCYNLGIRRDTSRDILQRWEKECALRLPELCDARIVLSCGINDTTFENGFVRVTQKESITNVRRILQIAMKYRALMVGPPPVVDDEQNQRIKTLSQSFAHEANQLSIPYIDIFTSLIADDSYKLEISNNDGAHPKSNGYTEIAKIILSSPSWWFHTAEDNSA
jgi:acyl-CoA thioesterase I